MMGYVKTAMQTVSVEAVFKATTMAVVVVAGEEVEAAEEIVTTAIRVGSRSRYASTIGSITKLTVSKQ